MGVRQDGRTLSDDDIRKESTLDKTLTGKTIKRPTMETNLSAYNSYAKAKAVNSSQSSYIQLKLVKPALMAPSQVPKYVS